MKKKFGFILLTIVFFNNLANAAIWPSNPIINYETSYKEIAEHQIYCQERGFQTYNSYYNCLKNLNHLLLKLFLK
jgi:hypothetical protein